MKLRCLVVSRPWNGFEARLSRTHRGRNICYQQNCEEMRIFLGNLVNQFSVASKSLSALFNSLLRGTGQSCFHDVLTAERATTVSTRLNNTPAGKNTPN